MKDRFRFFLINLGLAILLTVLISVSMIISSLISYALGSAILSVFVFPMAVLLSGLVYSRVLQDQKYLSIISSGVLGSMIISVVSGFQKVMLQSLEQVSEVNSEIGAVNTPSLQTSTIMDPNILFLSMIIAFNIPIIYLGQQKQDRETYYLALYSIPFLVYISLPLLI
ncbi:hypothetical protein GLU60_02490 [Nanohaloarchaea archaeon H01]|nr:hypothetical protein [Nanohaloarchaea archaeon H01]